MMHRGEWRGTSRPGQRWRGIVHLTDFTLNDCRQPRQILANTPSKRLDYKVAVPVGPPTRLKEVVRVYTRLVYELII
jgi:hypothetical protein